LIFGLAGAGVLIWLGLWQMDRLAWKQGVLANIETRITAGPVALPDLPEPARDKYLPVQMSGQFDEGAVRVLVSQKQVGAGYRIISPFEGEGRRILVDRGFIKVDAALPAAPAGAVQITGNLHWPDDRLDSTPENDVAGNIWFARDIGPMAEALNTEPVLLVLRDMSQPDGAVTPLPVDTGGIPNDHLSYAITWFSLAAIWLAMTTYYIQRTRRTGKGDSA
jgi:surfeit locus 1 family protein